MSIRLFGLLLVASMFAGCGTPGWQSSKEASASSLPPTKLDPAGGGTNAALPAPSSDLLRPGDAVVINFSGVTEPPPRVEDRINEDGFISLPFVRPVKAAGLTRSELQKEIYKIYVPRYYNERLTVSVNPDVRYFYVNGEVRRPGSYPYVGGMTVIKGIAAAGDFTDFAKKTKIQLIRANGTVTNINCIKAQRKSELDPAIFPDDRIFVPRRLW